MFDISNFSVKSKYYYKSNKLVVGNMEDEAGVEYGINEHNWAIVKSC